MTEKTGAVEGNVRLWLRAEGLCVLVAALLLYRHFGYGWLVFVLCFMVPDLTMLAYAGGTRIGAIVYNAAHSYVGPFLLGAFAVTTEPALYQPLLIWLAHIGFCRLARFGLKYHDDFDDTHLGTPPVNLPQVVLGLLARKT